MTRFAFPRSHGSVYAELPPTLQPFAIAASAPPANHLRAAGLSGLIYLLIASALFAASSLGHRVTPELVKPTVPEQIFVGDPPLNLTRILLPPVGKAGREGAPEASTATQVQSHAEVPDVAATGLSSEDHSRDMPAIGQVTNSSTTAPRDGTALSSTAGPVVHDFSMIGLEVLQKVDPVYPEIARRARVQGTVVLLMTVDEAGLPTQVKVLEGPPALQEAATRAARQWRFVPARLEGHTVAASFKLTLKFALR